jgi:hypothetical protein
MAGVSRWHALFRRVRGRTHGFVTFSNPMFHVKQFSGEFQLNSPSMVFHVKHLGLMKLNSRIRPITPEIGMA